MSNTIDFVQPENAVLTEKMLSRVLNIEVTSPRTKSVPTPNAQTSTLCAAHGIEEKDLMAIEGSLQLIRNQSQVCYYIAVLQYGFGLRISEVLDISPLDITLTGHVRIREKKGSNERMIFSDLCKEYLIDCKRLGKYPFADYDRFYMYRLYKKVGLSRKFGNNSKASVTHLFRHIASLSAQDSGISKDTRRRQLGHKSSKSTEYYGKSSKRSHRN